MLRPVSDSVSPAQQPSIKPQPSAFVKKRLITIPGITFNLPHYALLLQ
ncbi:MAG: hypothetical protein LBI89_00405 [Prevotellaceae bacterium]|nr:hypothetical protein [Prevotellaceae bacterium]